MINQKIQAALAAELSPVVCIGGAIEREMREVLSGLTPEQTKKLILVYEPEWAISTNKNAIPATPEDCGRAIELMRKVAKEMFGDTQIPILYGGSTSSENIKDFIESGAQGALVGSSSLDASEFVQLVRNAVIR
jgi:triosephosphate isomerase